jgi:hypothetical protein
MHSIKPLQITAAVFFSFLLAGCKFQIQDTFVQQSLKADQIVEYTPQGGLVFGSVVTPLNDGNIVGIDFLMEDSPDFTLPIRQNGGVHFFLVDVPQKSAGISRIGVRHNNLGFEESTWFLDFMKYSIPIHTNYTSVVTNNDISIVTTIRNNQIVSVTNKGGTATNRIRVVNYIGRFVFSIRNKFALPKDNYVFQYTNDIEKDRDILFKNYPELTNAEIYFIELQQKK